MRDPNLSDRMRDDWNRRALEDANYYVAFGRRAQPDDEFFATAADVVRTLEAELPRLPGRDAALEIGCGPGRLMRPLSRHFTGIHGVDVSDEMIRLARERLHDVPNAHAHVGGDLAAFGEACFDYVYSYAVFQHIPSREVVFRYLAEAGRVLKPRGILRCQVNGLPPGSRPAGTWEGVRISAAELREFTRAHGLQLLALEGAGTQYLWITCRKQPPGWRPVPGRARLLHVSNAYTGEKAAPVSGPMAALSLRFAGLPPDADLNYLQVAVDGRACRPVYIGEPDCSGITQVNVMVPAGLRTGLAPVSAVWLGETLCDPAWVRLIPPGPLVPRVVSITDGVNLMSPACTRSGTVKVTADEVRHPNTCAATLDGVPVRDTESFCVDPVRSRYEFNFHIPDGVGAGTHVLRLTLGTRELAVCALEVG
jgi:SAM-dependent methyltransferase